MIIGFLEWLRNRGEIPIEKIDELERLLNSEKEIPTQVLPSSGGIPQPMPRIYQSGPNIVAPGIGAMTPGGFVPFDGLRAVQGASWYNERYIGKRFHPDSLTMAFKAFKVGLVLTIVGLAFWALFLVSNKATLALWASAIAAFGANIVMLAVLGGRRGAA